MTVPQRRTLDSLHWDELPSDALAVWRTKVPGGWLVFAKRVDGAGLTFFPDPEHQWNAPTPSLTSNRQDSRKDKHPDVTHDQRRRRRAQR